MVPGTLLKNGTNRGTSTDIKLKSLKETLERDPWGKPYKIVLKELNESICDPTTRIPRKEINEIPNGSFPTAPRERTNGMPVEFERERITNSEIELVLKQSAERKPAERAIKIITTGTVRVFDRCLSAGYYPDEWKESRLVLLKKEGKPEGLYRRHTGQLMKYRKCSSE